MVGAPEVAFKEADVMRIFVINLAKRKDRLEHMTRQLSAFERVEAVDGAAVRNPPVNRFLFWCSKGYGVKPGEIGCALSHQNVYRMIVEQGIDVACVLEDDVSLSEDFEGRIEALATDLRVEAPSVLAFAETAAGYLINQSGARLMLSVNSPIRSTADDWRRWERAGLRWRMVEGVLTISRYGDPRAEGIEKSDIIGDARQFVVNMSWGRKAVFKLGRVIGKAVDCIWR